MFRIHLGNAWAPPGHHLGTTWAPPGNHLGRRQEAVRAGGQAKPAWTRDSVICLLVFVSCDFVILQHHQITNREFVIL